MFEELETTDRMIATEAVYRVGLRIYERDRFPDWRRWLTGRPPCDDPDAIPLAERILETVERVTGKPLAELTDEEVRPHTTRIDQIMSARRRRENRVPPERVDQILAEMRAQYGRPEERNVA